MAIITLSEVKTLLSIKYDAKDDLINLLIPSVDDDIKAYTGQSFVDDVPAGLKIYAARMIGYNLNNMDKSGIQSESISRYSVTFSINSNVTSGYPADIISGLNKYRKLKWGKPHDC